MKTNILILVLLAILSTPPTHAQFLKKLKEKVEQAAGRGISRESNKQSSGNNSSEINTQESENIALNKNTKAKKDFYKSDMVIKLHENGNLNQTQFFDANEVATKIESNQPQPGYIDSEGFIYTYKNGEYTKSSIVALQSQGLMVPTMMLNTYKLPPEPFMALFQKQTDLGLTPNPFNGIVEFAFIYKPDDFRYEDFKEIKQTKNGKTYTKFEFLNEPSYEGSYVLFDSQNQLVEIFTKIGESKDSFEIGEMPREKGESLLTYTYQPVEIKLPVAREVRIQGQGLMESVMGGIVKGGNQPKDDIDEDDYDTSNSKGMTKRVKESIKNHKVKPSDLPTTYDFDWELQTEMVLNTKRKEIMNLTFLIKEGAQYQATKMSTESTKNMGKTIMLFDMKLNSSIIFLESQSNKFMQIHPIPDTGKAAENINDYIITNLPTKTILNYNCEGLQMEDDRYIMKIYHTTEAEVTLQNFLNLGGPSKMELPNIDPRIIKQFSNGLIMEMDIIDKKKAKNNVNIIAKALNKTANSLKPSQYKSMNLFSGARIMNGN